MTLHHLSFYCLYEIIALTEIGFNAFKQAPKMKINKYKTVQFNMFMENQLLLYNAKYIQIHTQFVFTLKTPYRDIKQSNNGK